MGSFNSSGFISKLPIQYGDRVVCFIATENPSSSIRSLYIPDCHLVPWGIPVRGKYNDYGSIQEIDEDYNTDFLRRLFKVDNVEDIFNAVERCLYGDSVDENIKYWKHDKDEVKKYKMLLPMYGNIKEYLRFMNSAIGKGRRPTQPLCTLLFEHESVYDFITSKDVDDGWHTTDFSSAIDAHINLIKLTEELNKLVDEYYDEPEKNKFHEFKTFFESNDDFDVFKYTIFEIEKDFDGIAAQKSELAEKIKAKYAEYKEMQSRSGVDYGREGRSPMFMFQLKLMKPETYLKFFEEKKDELLHFCRLMRYMSYAPLLFECSITAGQQDYNAKGFIELYDYLHKFSKKLFKNRD